MALPDGVKYVYKAFGLPIPASGHEEDPPMPVSSFEDELADAAIFLKNLYPASEFPCLYQSGELDPANPDDARLYDRALGYYAAYLIAGGVGNAYGVGGPIMTQRKLMDITYTFKQVNAEDKKGAFYDQSIASMEAMSCVTGDASGILGLDGAGLLRVVNPNRDAFGRLIDNTGILL